MLVGAAAAEFVLAGVDRAGAVARAREVRNALWPSAVLVAVGVGRGVLVASSPLDSLAASAQLFGVGGARQLSRSVSADVRGARPVRGASVSRAIGDRRPGGMDGS